MGLSESKNISKNISNEISSNEVLNHDYKLQNNDYYNCLPYDIQKLIIIYLTDTISINKMLYIYPQLEKRIYNSIEILEYKYNDKKYKYKNSKKMMLMKCIKDTDVILMKNLVHTDLDYRIKINCIDDLNKITEYKFLQNLKIMIMKKINVNVLNETFNMRNVIYITNKIDKSREGNIYNYCEKIVNQYLNMHNYMKFNSDICYSSIEIYDNESFNPIFIYKNGLLGLRSGFIKFIFNIWKILEERGCILRGFIINSRFDTSELNMIRNFVKYHKYLKYYDTENSIFDTFVINYQECYNLIDDKNIASALEVGAEIIKALPHYVLNKSDTFNIKFDLSTYNNTNYIHKITQEMFIFALIRSNIHVYCKLNISLVKYFNISNINTLNYETNKKLNHIDNVLSQFFHMHLETTKVYFTPIFKNISNLNLTYQFLQNKYPMHVHKLYIDSNTAKEIDQRYKKSNKNVNKIDNYSIYKNLYQNIGSIEDSIPFLIFPIINKKSQ